MRLYRVLTQAAMWLVGLYLIGLGIGVYKSLKSGDVLVAVLVGLVGVFVFVVVGGPLYALLKWLESKEEQSNGWPQPIGSVYRSTGEEGDAADVETAMDDRPARTYAAYQGREVEMPKESAFRAAAEGRWHDAIQLLNKLLPPLGSPDAECYAVRAQARVEIGELDKAIRDFERASKLNPNESMIYNDLGTCYLHKDQIDQAIAYYKKAVGLDSRNARALTNLGTAYMKKGQPHTATPNYVLIDSAFEAFGKAKLADPLFPITYRECGLLLLAQGKYQEAISELNRALSLDPNYAEAYYDRGLAYQEMGEFSKASDNFRVAQRLDPDLPIL